MIKLILILALGGTMQLSMFLIKLCIPFWPAFGISFVIVSLIIFIIITASRKKKC